MMYFFAAIINRVTDVETAFERSDEKCDTTIGLFHKNKMESFQAELDTTHRTLLQDRVLVSLVTVPGRSARVSEGVRAHLLDGGIYLQVSTGHWYTE